MRAGKKITNIFTAIFMTAAISLSVGAQTVLVDEDWQLPLFPNSQIRVSGDFTNWTCNAGLYSNREDNDGSVPGDATITFPNQVIQLNGDSTYAEYDISHNWAVTDTYYLMVQASPSSWNGTIQRYIRPDLRQQDGTVLWSTAADTTTAVPLYDNFGAMTDWPSELTFWFTIDASTFTAGTAGQPLRLRLDASGQRSLYINNVKLTLLPLPADNMAPTPDPLTWDAVPAVVDYVNASMKADSVRDDLYDVEYLFTNAVKGTSSGWQDERTWTETGLDYGTLYTYQVKARDKSPNNNETAWSSSQSITTPTQDLTPPSPDPLTWDVVPTVGDYGYITMTANTASDLSGVEYLFTNTVNGTSSGWQDSTTWNDGGLDHATLYTYKAKVRDKSVDQNVSTTWSSEESATTPSVPEGTLVITRFQCPLYNDGTELASGAFAGWDFWSGPKSRRAPSNGLPGDDDVSGVNQAIQFEWTNDEMQYDIDHNWAASDLFTLTVNAAPQDWSKTLQRYIRPSIRQQNGTVLWAPGENTNGLEKTSLPKDVSFGGSTWQAESDDLEFTFTIDASTFTAGAEGQPIALRIDSSGARGMYVDNVFLGMAQPEPPSGTLILLR